MTQRQKQLIENYVRKQVRKSLLEASQTVKYIKQPKNPDSKEVQISFTPNKGLDIRSGNDYISIDVANITLLSRYLKEFNRSADISTVHKQLK